MGLKYKAQLDGDQLFLIVDLKERASIFLQSVGNLQFPSQDFSRSRLPTLHEKAFKISERATKALQNMESVLERVGGDCSNAIVDYASKMGFRASQLKWEPPMVDLVSSAVAYINFTQPYPSTFPKSTFMARLRESGLLKGKQASKALSTTALRALAWVAHKKPGPFELGLGFTRNSLEALERQGLITRKDPEARRLMELHKAGPDALRRNHDYEWFAVTITDLGRSLLNGRQASGSLTRADKVLIKLKAAAQAFKMATEKAKPSPIYRALPALKAKAAALPALLEFLGETDTSLVDQIAQRLIRAGEINQSPQGPNDSVIKALAAGLTLNLAITSYKVSGNPSRSRAFSTLIHFEKKLSPMVAKDLKNREENFRVDELREKMMNVLGLTWQMGKPNRPDSLLEEDPWANLPPMRPAV